MFNVGPMELMVLLVMALIVFGPAKLPELMGSVGRAIREFRKASTETREAINPMAAPVQQAPAPQPAQPAPQPAQPAPGPNDTGSTPAPSEQSTVSG